MRYISTRGQAPALNFEDVLLAGLASDGGLYVPENLPRFTQEEIASWAGLPYHELAFRVMRPFVTGSIPDADFKKILEETYGAFSHAAVAPLRARNIYADWFGRRNLQHNNLFWSPRRLLAAVSGFERQSRFLQFASHAQYRQAQPARAGQRSWFDAFQSGYFAVVAHTGALGIFLLPNLASTFRRKA